MSDNKELIWVDKEFAAKYNKMESDGAKIEQRAKILDEYIQGLTSKSKNEFKVNLEALEEDAVIYSGLMIKVKQAFEKAKNEALDASYEVWEKWDKKKPAIEKKVNAIVKTLDPLQEKLKSINDLFGKIDTYNIEKLISSIEMLRKLYGESREIFDFVVNNYKRKD